MPHHHTSQSTVGKAAVIGRRAVKKSVSVSVCHPVVKMDDVFTLSPVSVPDINPTNSFTPSCPVCAVVLMNCNELECNEHVMRCLNSSETAVERFVDANECPCCGKLCLSMSDLQGHLQICGVEVTSSSLASTSVTGTFTGTIPSTASGPTGKRKRQACITMKALKKMDEQTQVALALSVSLQPENVSHNRKAAKKSSRITVKFTPPPPMLIERNPEDSKKIVADRVAVLVGKSCTGGSCVSFLPESKLSETGQPLDNAASDTSSRRNLWNLSERLSSVEMDSFYVDSLVPPLSPCKEYGSAHFRSLSQIPGFKLRSQLEILQPASHQNLESTDWYDKQKLSEGRTEHAVEETHEVLPLKNEDYKCRPASPCQIHPLVGDVFRTSDDAALHSAIDPIIHDEDGQQDCAEESDDNDDARTLILFSSSEDELD